MPEIRWLLSVAEYMYAKRGQASSYDVAEGVADGIQTGFSGKPTQTAMAMHGRRTRALAMRALPEA